MMEADALEAVRDQIELVTFDCYGTLVDWEKGMRAAIAELSGDDHPAVFDAYLKEDAEIEAGCYRLYRDVLAEALRRIAGRFGFQLTPEQGDVLADTLPSWPLWPDTNEALERIRSRYRIGVLSNIDRDLFAGTEKHFSVNIDMLVTAEDVRSYKPSHNHFMRAIEQVGGNRKVLLHAAQSLYHDCVPATQLGINNVWINRRAETNDTPARPLAVYPDLTALADALGV